MVKPAGSDKIGEPQCSRCGLYKKCKSPKMPASGRGRMRILVLAEAPGKDEDDQGKQLVGNSGRELEDTLERLGVSMRKDCILHNSLICRPPNNVISDRKAIDYCRPNTIRTIQEYRPKVIIALGGTAMQSLAGWLWKPKADQIGQTEPWVGMTIPAQQINAWIVPTYHPSYLLRQKDPVLEMFFERHLKAAIRLAEKGKRPWKKGEVKSLLDNITLITRPVLALKYIRHFIDNGKPVCFDYETNRGKPDGPGARIRCVSVSDGRATVAFEFGNSGVDSAWKDFLRSDTPKIMHNAKFEERWSKAIFGVWPKNVINCTMDTAHVLDGRQGITGLKFLSFVKLGQPDYDSHIQPYLKGKGSYGNNRVFDLPVETVLRYCAIDSLCEHRLWELQNKERESYARS